MKKSSKKGKAPRRRSSGRFGIKDSGIAILAGIGAGALADAASRNVAIMRSHALVTPGALAVLGAVANAKGFTRIGTAVCGAAGTLGYLNVRMAQATAAAQGETAGLMNQGTTAARALGQGQVRAVPMGQRQAVAR